MTDVYIHVGFPKTGTTFLQEHYFPHLKGVLAITQTVPYPPVGVIERLWRIGETYPLFVDMDEQKAEVDEFLREAGDDKVLISSERLVGDHILGFRDHFQVTQGLRELWPSAKIILTIRRQDDYLESLYRQFLKTYCSPTVDGFLGYVPKGRVGSERDNNHGFENWLRPPFSFPNINVSRLDYHAYAQHYATAFGRQNVMVLPQEMLRKDPDRFHTELADFIGVEPYFPPPDHGEVNRAYSLLSCRIAMLLNRFVRHPRLERRPWRFIPHQPLTPYLRRLSTHGRAYRLLDAINQRLTLGYVLRNVVDRIHYRQGQIINDEKRRLIMQIHHESNRKLDEDYHINLREYGYY